jgi:hypothetical protein
MAQRCCTRVCKCFACEGRSGAAIGFILPSSVTSARRFQLPGFSAAGIVCPPTSPRAPVLQRTPFPCSWFFAGLSSCTYSPQVPSSFPLLLQPLLRNRFHYPCPSGVSMKTTDGFGLKGVCAATHCGGSGASRRPSFAAKGSWECDLK